MARFNKHGIAVLYKEPTSNVYIQWPATPRVFHSDVSDVHFGHLHHTPSILGSRGAGKTMLTESLMNIWNGFK